jgi:serine/threonine-protein kinase
LPQTIRQYEVLKEIGSGHFGRVNLCFGETPARGIHPAKARLVGIKTLKNARDDESLRLLLQEFALLDQVKHRSVVRVFEYLDEERAVVMEYVHGTTLRDVLDACAQKREQVFSEAAVEIGCEIADALYQAWTTPADNGESLRLVHRDLKPENIMLTPAGEVKILDFGLARVENADFAHEDPSRIRGTPIYMAPEQARGEEIDHRTDLFALGLILYELLMARPAYRVPVDAADPIAATYAAIEAGQLTESCRELEVKLPGLGSIVTRLLQARPRNRYQTGHDLLVDLRRQLYKDRGAYLKEFCSFFFGSVRPLPEAPDPRNPAKGIAMSTPPRKSIEERLKESLEKEAEPVGKVPVPVRRAPRVPEPEPEPRAPTPVSAAPRITPKIVPRTASAAAKTDDEVVMPPSVKGKPAAPAPAPKKPTGARSADENGMLPMVPLNENADEREVSGDHSATAFFAIPGPKAERARSAPSGPPTPPMTPPQASPRPFTPPPAVAAPAPAPTPLGIQGPTVGYGAAQTPFQTAGPQQQTQENAESRVQSWRVYAILVAVMGLAAMFLVAVVAVGWWKISQDTEKPTETIATAAPPPPPPKHKQEDTAAPRPAQAQPAPVKAPTRRPTASAAAGSAPAQPAAPRADKGTVTVTFTSTPAPMSIEVRCGDFAARGTVSGGTATITNVPSGAECKMYPKGGVTATAFPVKSGARYSCAITGTTTSCH